MDRSTQQYLWYTSTSHFCPCVPWYKWTGWTGVHNSICGTLVHPTSVLVSRGTSGRDGQEYTRVSVVHYSTSHFCPCVLWYKWTGWTAVHNGICGCTSTSRFCPCVPLPNIQLLFCPKTPTECPLHPSVPLDNLLHISHYTVHFTHTG